MTLHRQRLAKYSFGAYNPYLPADGESALVQENLKRLKAGETNVRGFLRQTPHFARWRDEQIRQARILLVTNEPGLSKIEKLYGDMVSAKNVKEVAKRFHTAMLSWLSLSNHPLLGTINGEHPWVESGDWESEHPSLAVCGKAGYFMSPGEEKELAGCKVMHMELSPFSQESGTDVNPRNDQAMDYHKENRKTIERFCRIATQESKRYIFFIGNRARIRCTDTDTHRLVAVRSSRKDKSCKIADMLGIISPYLGNVHVRVSRHWPAHGIDVEALSVTRSIAYELRRLPLTRSD
jgi:hypothetical protein